MKKGASRALGATENKVQFNIKNVHYAVLDDSGESPSWGTPVHVPGAVSLSLDQQGEVTPFYADGIVYYQSANNNGYSGDLEMARLIDQMRIDIWGAIQTQDQVLMENANSKVNAFALLFEIDGDKNEDYYCLYNCTATRPGIAGQTSTDTKEPQTQTTTISAVALENGNVMARTTGETSAEVKNSWFQAVYVPKDAAVGTAKVGEAKVS